MVRVQKQEVAHSVEVQVQGPLVRVQKRGEPRTLWPRVGVAQVVLLAAQAQKRGVLHRYWPPEEAQMLEIAA